MKLIRSSVDQKNISKPSTFTIFDISTVNELFLNCLLHNQIMPKRNKFWERNGIRYQI